MPRLSKEETAKLIKKQKAALREKQAADLKLQREANALKTDEDGLVEVKYGGKKRRVDPLRAAKLLQLEAARKALKKEAE